MQGFPESFIPGTPIWIPDGGEQFCELTMPFSFLHVLKPLGQILPRLHVDSCEYVICRGKGVCGAGGGEAVSISPEDPVCWKAVDRMVEPEGGASRQCENAGKALELERGQSWRSGGTAVTLQQGCTVETAARPGARQEGKACKVRPNSFSKRRDAGCMLQHHGSWPQLCPSLLLPGLTVTPSKQKLSRLYRRDNVILTGPV